MAHALLRRLHNPRGYECDCDPDCWCRSRMLGRAFRWWFPAHRFGIEHKSAAVEEWKRTNPELAAIWKQERAVARTRTARIVDHDPCFAVADLARAIGHYQQLGFAISFHDESYAFAHRDRLTIHLARRDEPTPGTNTLYLHVDDADRLAEDWRAAGLRVDGLRDTDYGKREGSHSDPDGNVIRFGSPLARQA